MHTNESKVRNIEAKVKLPRVGSIITVIPWAAPCCLEAMTSASSGPARALEGGHPLRSPLLPHLPLQPHRHLPPPCCLPSCRGDNAHPCDIAPRWCQEGALTPAFQLICKCEPPLPLRSFGPMSADPRSPRPSCRPHTSGALQMIGASAPIFPPHHQLSHGAIGPALPGVSCRSQEVLVLSDPPASLFCQLDTS